MSKFYVTTAIPYVNAKPHIGHALEFVQCDVIARYHRLIGDETRLLSGADENALKNVQAAEKAGKPIQEFVDENSQAFIDLSKAYHVQIDVFQRGSDKEKHYPASQKLWELCNNNGDIYQKEYEGLYCVGCEMFYAEDELDEQGECFHHPGKKLEKVSEKNYFFKLSKYQEQILDLITKDTLKIIPRERKNEILGFLKEPLQDISISRTNERAKNWGVPVPGDDTQKMYVWFDALNIYQSGVGFGWDDEQYKTWWPADAQVIGKDIIRFHAVYWPAFLLSAGLQPPRQLYVHGFITSQGQKMSKTVGNVIDPITFLEKYGVDAVRYYLLREVPSGKDGDVSDDRFKEVYNADLANGLGNLISRVAKLAHKHDLMIPVRNRPNQLMEDVGALVRDFKFDKALEVIWMSIANLDKYINRKEPWRQTKQESLKTLQEIIIGIEGLASLVDIGEALQPFLPQTAEKMLKQFGGEKVTIQQPYFKRL